MSLERWLISRGIVPNSSFMLRSTYARLGRDENGKSWSVPFKLEFVKFNVITLPTWVQEIPNQLHGLELELVFWLLKELVALLGRRVHEGRGDCVSFWRLAFQMSRASIFASSFTEREATSNEDCKMANATREKRENTFFKLVNAMGLCFTSCKLVQNSI